MTGAKRDCFASLAMTAVNVILRLDQGFNVIAGNGVTKQSLLSDYIMIRLRCFDIRYLMLFSI
jgi:hypothetical protein